jgi:hypothetical protein
MRNTKINPNFWNFVDESDFITSQEKYNANLLLNEFRDFMNAEWKKEQQLAIEAAKIPTLPQSAKIELTETTKN